MERIHRRIVCQTRQTDTNQNRNEVDVCEDNKGSYLLESEILQTIKEMTDVKSAGCDKITAELIKNSGTTTTTELAQIG